MHTDSTAGPSPLPSPFEPGSPFALGLLLRKAHERVGAAMDAALVPFGIERRHLMVLMRLSGEGALSQKELVERTQHDKASMVRIVDDLERLGLASRELVPGDRRLRAVTLTEHGRDVYRQAHHAAMPAARASTAPLTAKQAQQLETLLRIYLAD
jgi:MarR family transcriptional regulator, lower aerobic nicotinate degradation pathway regulator